MKTKSLLVVLVVALIGVGAALAVARTALAKGPPQKVTISGEGLVQEIAYIGDQQTLDALAMMTLEDYTTRTPDAPDGISSDGYLLTRFYDTSNGVSKPRYVAFDQVRYYPNPDGGRGYLYYVGIVNGSSEYDGNWFRPSAEGETALQSLITSGQQAQTAARDAFLRVIALFGH